MFGHAYGAVDFNNMADRRTDTTGISFAELGIPPPPKLQDTLLGKVSAYG